MAFISTYSALSKRGYSAGGTPVTPTPFQTLDNPNAAANTYFGAYLSFSDNGNVLAILDAVDNLYIYNYDNGNSNYFLHTTISGNANSAYANIQVSGDGNYIILGDTYNNGYAFIYSFSSNTWSLQDTLTASDPQSTQFGSKVSINFDGSYAIVGDSTHSTSPQSNDGAAYIYRNISNVWYEISKVDGNANNQRLGTSVDMTGNVSGTYIAVGAPGYQVSGSNVGVIRQFYVQNVSPNSVGNAGNLIGNTSYTVGQNPIFIDASGTLLYRSSNSAITGSVIFPSPAGQLGEEELATNGSLNQIYMGQTYGNPAQNRVIGYATNGTAYFLNVTIFPNYSPVATNWGSRVSIGANSNILAVGDINYTGTFTEQGRVYLYRLS